MRQDARVWQAVVLGSTLLLGIFFLDFPLSPTIIAATLVSGTLGEYLLSSLLRAGREPRPLSALISGFSVLLLFRSSVWWTYPLVILFAISLCHLMNDMMSSLLAAIYPNLKTLLDLSFTQIGFVTLTYNSSGWMG